MNRFDDQVDNDLEKRLQESFRRVDAPPGFADRVLARVAQQSSGTREPRNWRSFFTLPGMRFAAVAAASVALIAGGLHLDSIHRAHVAREIAQRAAIERDRAQGEAAKQRLMLALRIAGSKLQLARTKVNQINADGTDPQQERE
jgi:hypothetical protein